MRRSLLGREDVVRSAFGGRGRYVCVWLGHRDIDVHRWRAFRRVVVVSGLEGRRRLIVSGLTGFWREIRWRMRIGASPWRLIGWFAIIGAYLPVKE